MKLFNNILKKAFPFLILALLAFIPLYPKIPLIDIQHTWVYVRFEDVLVLIVLTLWFYLLLRKEVTIKTPLTIPIFAFWIIGAIATIHGVIIIFPTIANVFPNVALLAYLRHIEYLSVFFMAYTAVKSKKFIFASIWTLIATLVGVIIYGFGQKFFAFPAFLTMNEEYAKGVPITVSSLNRISSTFAGHYDLAAYLVLVLPIVVSLIFGFRNILMKALLTIISLLGLVLLFMTVSRVSFFVLFIGLFAVVFFQKRKLFFALVPLIFIGGIIFMYSNSSLLSRFGNTVKQVDVLVDSKTGGAIGHVHFEPRSYFKDKIIKDEIVEEGVRTATPSGKRLVYDPDIPLSLVKYRIPQQLAIVDAITTSTGETLPQGSGYINLTLSPVTQRLENFFYEFPENDTTASASLRIVQGDFLVKRAAAYDLSFTTRFQGEWPHALMAFARNIFFGSGYGSVSLAVDNNYFRMLGETGLLGTVAFFGVIIMLLIYIRRNISPIDSPVVRALVYGAVGGIIGLSLNATLIDVFEASKVAFVLWLLVGIVVGSITLYQTRQFNVYKEIIKAATSSYALIVYFLFLIVVIFSLNINTYFSGDDFTWFRWAADCKLQASCHSPFSTIYHYFFNSDGFFYRPGTKTYFLLMYPLFWLNQVVYHAVSIGLHFIVVVLLYFLSRKIFKNNLLAAASSFTFLFASGYLEVVLWIASTGDLFNAIFMLLSLFAFIKWYESKKILYLVLSIITSFMSMMFHELGIISPLLPFAYLLYVQDQLTLRSVVKLFKIKAHLALFISSILYLFVRLISQAHWFNGDYNYNLVKLPFNLLGNLFGYVVISILGPMGYPVYEKIRLATKSNIPLAVILGLIIVAALYFIGRFIFKNLTVNEKKVALFSMLFFFICLLPFVGLGNITYRYSYLASFGIMMFVVLVIAKLYRYLLVYGRDIAAGAILTITCVFLLFHIIQAQQTMIDWNGAGMRAQNFLSSIDASYTSAWTNKNIKSSLYFTNVPILVGDAWVFPVGLTDAIWFAFDNDNIEVLQYPDIESIPQEVYTAKDKWVYQFQPDGTVKRVIWTKKGPTTYVK